MFQFHNESMNVWTHLLAVVLIARKLFLFSGEIDFIGDPYSWHFLSGIMSGLLLYSFSAFAHCMQSKSEMFHYTAFMFDYAGIGLYGIGSVILHLNYCSEPAFYNAVNSWFVPLGSVIGFAIYACCTVAKTMYKRPYPFARKIWQMVPVAGIYALLISPIAHRLFICGVYGEGCNESIPYHVREIMWFLLSGFFFATDMPQRFLPGFCDVFFHSHQIFHICIMICTLTQMDGVYLDFLIRNDNLHLRPEPTFLSAFGPVISVLVIDLVCICLTAVWIERHLITDRPHKKSE